MPAAPGSRSSTASRSARSARSRSRRRIRTCSTSAPAKPTCARTSRRATACTNRSTPARPGRRSVSTTRQQIGRILVDPHDRDSRVRRRARPSVRTERRARRVPLARWRQALEQGARPRRRHRRDRPRVRAGQSAGDLRRAVADAAPAVERLSAVERAGQRAVQIHRWRRQLATGPRQRLRARQRRPHRHRVSRRAIRNACTRSSIGDEGGLYRSDDAGAHWRKSSGDPRIWQRGWYFGRITVDPKNADRVYAMNTIVLRSDDGGTTLHRAQGRPHRRRFPRTVDRPDRPGPADPRRRPGRDRHAQRRQDLESSWYNQPTAQIYHVSHRQPVSVPRLRCAAGFRRGRAAEPQRQRQRHHDGAVPRGHRRRRERHDRARSATIPTSSTAARVDKLDLRTRPDPQRRSDARRSRSRTDAPGRCRWCSSQRDRKRCISATRRSVPHARRRRTLGRDQPRPDARRLRACRRTSMQSRRPNNLGPSPRRGVIYAIAPSPLADGLIWVGTDDGLVWRTRDDGAHWDNVTPTALTRVVEGRHASKPRTSMRTPRTSRSTAIASTTARRTSTAPAMAARAGSWSSPASATATSSTWCARIRCDAACSMPAPSSACTCRSTTASTGSRCSRTCRVPRCATSTCMATTW